MTILFADFIFTCNDRFEIIEDGAICFGEKIICVGKKNEIVQKYKNTKIQKLPKNSIVMPGLVNPHTHLEFTSNIAKLTYGDYITWLNCIIKNREEIQRNYDDKLVKSALLEMLKSGTTTIGNISSYGEDALVCKEAHQRIVYFVEAIGSHPDAIDPLFNHAQARFFEAQEYKSETFVPALSIHSLYSTHPLLAKKIIDLAKHENLLVSTHFMESKAERDWVDRGDGGFKDFFSSFSHGIKPMYKSSYEFLELFSEVKSLFTHAVYANEDEIHKISNFNSTITHCPVSNMLLGSGRLDIDKVLKNRVPFTLGTDGLSSNISLSLWDEMRSALMMHCDKEIEELAKILLLAVTKNGSEALGINSGELRSGANADIISIILKEVPTNLSQLPLQLILQTKIVEDVYIKGEKIEWTN